MNRNSILNSAVNALFCKSSCTKKIYVLLGVFLLITLFLVSLYSQQIVIKDSETCAVCHMDTYNEWRQSAHAFTWQNPVMRGMFNEGYRVIPNSQRSCMHCFAPLGIVEQPDQPSDGSQLNSLAKQGIQCSFCHGIDLSSGLEQAQAFEIPVSDITAHITSMIKNKEFLASADFCAVCHSRKAQEFRNTSYGETGTVCQDCHMRPFSENPVFNQTKVKQTINKEKGKVSHLFTGVKIHHSMYSGLYELREKQLLLLNSVMNIHILKPEYVVQWQPLKVTVALSNVGSPHGFPGGRPPGKEVWVELIVRDADKNVISHIGRPQRHLRDIKDDKVLRRIYISNETGKVAPRYWKVLGGNSVTINKFVPPDSTIYQEFTIYLPVKTEFPLSITANIRYKSLMQEYADMYIDRTDFDIPAIIIASHERKIEKW